MFGFRTYRVRFSQPRTRRPDERSLRFHRSQAISSQACSRCVVDFHRRSSDPAHQLQDRVSGRGGLSRTGIELSPGTCAVGDNGEGRHRAGGVHRTRAAPAVETLADSVIVPMGSVKVRFDAARSCPTVTGSLVVTVKLNEVAEARAVSRPRSAMSHGRRRRIGRAIMGPRSPRASRAILRSPGGPRWDRRPCRE